MGLKFFLLCLAKAMVEICILLRACFEVKGGCGLWVAGDSAWVYHCCLEGDSWQCGIANIIGLLVATSAFAEQKLRGGL